MSTERPRRLHGNASSLVHMPASSLAGLVARARINARLSQRELARLAGISNSTLAQLERGDDPRWDTLRALGAVLPGLTAASALHSQSRHPPQASAAAVRALRRLLMIGCERVRLRVDASGAGPAETELTIEAAALELDLGEREACTTLMRATCGGSAPFRRSLDGAWLLDAGGSLTLVDGAHEHHFELTRGPRPVVDYRRVGPGSSEVEIAGASQDARLAPGASLQVSLPARELQLEIRPAATAAHWAADIRAWMPSGMREPAESDLARSLYPGGVGVRIERSGLTARATIAEPMLGVVFGLVLVSSPRDEPSRLGGSRDRLLWFVGRNASAVRVAAGLSLREMAQRVGVSWATVRQIESGRPARASTMQAYLREFPELAPQELLPVDEAAGELSQDELWDYQVRLFGFCADHVEKTLRVKLDGRVQTTVATKRIRAQAHGEARSTVSLRLGVGRAVLSDQPSAPITKVRASSEKTRLRTFQHRDGKVTHQFTFPASLFSTGATYRRIFAWRSLFSMFEERAAATGPEEPPFLEGTSLALLHPARVLRLVVEFPRGYRPSEFLVHAWPEAHVPDPDMPEVLDVLPRMVRLAQLDVKRSRAVLEVTRPLVGLRYAVAWILPRRGRR